MTDKRKLRRVKKRLRLSFETGDRRGTGITVNLSPTGMLVSSSLVFPPGARIRGRVLLPEGTEASFEALVRWARRLRGPDTLLMQNSMGVEFLTPPEQAYFDYVKEAFEQAEARAAIAQAASLPPKEQAVSQAASPREQTVSPRESAAAPRRAVAEVRAAPAAGSATAAISPQGRLRIGLDGLCTTVVGTGGPGSRQSECNVTPAQAAALIEEASLRAIAGLVPDGLVAFGAHMEVTLVDTSPVRVGSSIAATSRLVSMTANRTLSFEANVTERQRDIARGKFVCALLPSRTR